MGSRALLYVVVLWSFSTHLGIGSAGLSKGYLELEKQLKSLNKPSVKTIKTEYGDVYDCVDFYKQPGFDHPLLKNHSFYPEMRPSATPKWRTKPSTFSTEDKVLALDNIRLKEGCPKGTVPIRRVSRDDLIEMWRLSARYASASIKPNAMTSQPGSYLAVVQSKSSSPPAVYDGVGARISVYNPTVTTSQYSSFEVMVQGGSDSIRVGLTVNPSLNKDNLTRLFQYLDAGDSHCFNTLCPGFISVRDDFPIDIVIQPVSKVGGPTFDYKVLLYQDPKNGNWWLQVGEAETVIGFWPQKIFSGLSNSASYIAVGGEAYSPPGDPLPLMGTGWPTEYPSMSAFCCDFVVLDSNYTLVDPKDTEEYSSDKRYNAFDLGKITSGRTMFFGGPA